MHIKKRILLNIYKYFICTILLCGALPVSSTAEQNNFFSDDYADSHHTESVSFRSINGKLYAYIVLLYNENPHFVNIIQKFSIPLKIMAIEGFHIREYQNYLNTISDVSIKNIAKSMLDIYFEPEKFDNAMLQKFEKLLSDRNIILKFSRDKNLVNKKIILDYCIYGKKTSVDITHPLLTIKDKIYNIQPFIYYDEFSTSNSTFYYDMIYINPDEVQNDFIIAKKILNGLDVKSMFFVGSKVTDDMKFCIIKAFGSSSNIKKKIWEMFVIHELTHKYINNKYNHYDQVNGEELSLASTIFTNPYLGLSVMYSYLNYNSINPHRVAASNYVKFIANKSNNAKILDEPGLIKQFDESWLKNASREFFEAIIKKLN